MLLEYTTDASHKDIHDETALHKAVSHDQREVAQILCELYPCQVNIKNVRGETPMVTAARIGSRYVRSVQAGQELSPVNFSAACLRLPREFGF